MNPTIAALRAVGAEATEAREQDIRDLLDILTPSGYDAQRKAAWRELNESVVRNFARRREGSDRNLSSPALDVIEAAARMAEGYDAYVEAHAGRGHEGLHEPEPILDGDCGLCAGAQYGTEVEMNEYRAPALRAALDAYLTRAATELADE